MLDNFFELIKKQKYKYKFFEYLLQNDKFISKWNAVKFSLYYRPNSVKFFTQATIRTRINSITDILSDEKSKIVYNSMIKFRQSGKRKDYPTELSDDNQYFSEILPNRNENKMKFGKNEVFIDCGAFDGDTIEDFQKYCQEYEQIVAFEPEPANFKKLQTKYQTNPKVMLINAGAWCEEGTASFFGSGDNGMIIAGGGGGGFQLKSIDGLELENVTFIKMDIEGSEMNALKGAEKTILKHKPKMAICIYHSDNDMVDIPEYIHNLVPEYKLYVRHYQVYPNPCETIVYTTM